MVYAVLVLYLVVNAFLALSAHFAKLRSTVEEPRPREVAVFFLISLFLGLPAFLAALLFSRLHSSTSRDRQQTPVYVFPAPGAGRSNMRAAR